MPVSQRPILDNSLVNSHGPWSLVLGLLGLIDGSDMNWFEGVELGLMGRRRGASIAVGVIGVAEDAASYDAWNEGWAFGCHRFQR